MRLNWDGPFPRSSLTPASRGGEAASLPCWRAIDQHTPDARRRLRALRARERAFPHADHTPASCAQRACHFAVPLCVARELGLPKRAVVRGHRRVRGQPCQKQPSTNTATRSRRKTKSGLPKTRAWCRQPVMPRSCMSAMRRSSVARLPRERMSAITALRFAFVKTSVIRAFAVARGDLDTVLVFLAGRRCRPIAHRTGRVLPVVLMAPNQEIFAGINRRAGYPQTTLLASDDRAAKSFGLDALLGIDRASLVREM